MAKKSNIETIEARKKRIHQFLGVEDPVVRFVEGKKLGLKRLESEEVILPAEYDMIEVPKKDLLWVRKGNKYGFVSREGECIADCIYDEAGPFSEGRAYVCADGRFCGFIDEKGNELINLGFVPDGVSNPRFQDGVAIVSKEEKVGVIDLQGKAIVPYMYWSIENRLGYFIVKQDHGDRVGLYDTKGKQILPCKYQSIHIDGDILSVEFEDKYALFNPEGKQLTPFEFDELSTWWQRVAKNHNGDLPGYALAKKGKKIGVFSSAGMVVPVEYDDISVISWHENGVDFIVTDAVRTDVNDRGYGIYALDGREILAPSVDYNIIRDRKYTTGVLKAAGVEVKEKRSVRHGDFTYKDSGTRLEGIRKLSGEIITEPKYTSLSEEGKVGEKCYWKFNKPDTGEECVGLVDSDGVELIPCSCINIWFEGAFFEARNQKNKHGAFNLDGKQIAKFSWYRVIALSSGMICGYNKNKVAVYNMEGQEILAERPGDFPNTEWDDGLIVLYDEMIDLWGNSTKDENE